MQKFLEESLWYTYQNARHYVPEDTFLKVSSFQKEQLQVTGQIGIIFVIDALGGKCHECFMKV
jgi:hypothetical protein